MVYEAVQRFAAYKIGALAVSSYCSSLLACLATVPLMALCLPFSRSRAILFPFARLAHLTMFLPGHKLGGSGERNHLRA